MPGSIPVTTAAAGEPQPGSQPNDELLAELGLALPLNPKRVFVSSRADEFQAARDQIRNSRLLRGFERCVMEDEPDSRPLLERIREELAGSDFFYLMLGSQYGPPVPGSAISWVEYEFDTAWFLAERDPDFGMGIVRVRGATPEPALAAFMGRIQELTLTWRWFDPQNETADQPLLRMLKYWLERTIRSRGERVRRQEEYRRLGVLVATPSIVILILLALTGGDLFWWTRLAVCSLTMIPTAIGFGMILTGGQWWKTFPERRRRNGRR